MALGYKKEDEDDKYLPENYTPSAAVIAAQDAYNKHLENAPDFDRQLAQILESINSRKPFNYNMNTDALYQQYKNQFQSNAQLAMKDAMGQAAALTGGYGNSYAQISGQQAYNQQMSQLDNILPSLYQLALETHIQQGTDLQNQYAMVKSQQSEWEAERDRLLALYQDERDFDYGRYIDEEGGFTGTSYSEAVAYLESKGVPSGAAAGIMDKATWYRKKNGGNTTADVANYGTYQEYLEAITEYWVEQYREGTL